MSDVEAVNVEETAVAEVSSSAEEVSSVEEIAEATPAETPVEEADTTQVTAEDTAEVSPAPAADDDEVSIDNIKMGQHFSGTVKNITEFGAFVDVGIPQDGLVHISKLAKWKVEKVEDVVTLGQQVDVWVKKVDKKRGRLSLTMIKPISLRIRDIEEEAELDGTVTRLEPYGAFIDIGSEREGLVHISQISHDYIKHPEEALAVDDKVKVQVLKVDRKKRQVDLSIKALIEPPEPEVKEVVVKIPKAAAEAVEEEEPALTAMAVAYEFLQNKESAQTDDDKLAEEEKRQKKGEMDDIISRTLATRE